MRLRDHQSWGRVPKASDQRVAEGDWRREPVPDTRGSVLAYGLGRSYGDVCLNDGGVLLDVSRLDRVLRFDREAGTLRCEAGMTLEAVLRLVVPEGFFLPVSPGTKHVTVGGAVANDIHGKNHHREGTFGRHVTAFELLRSDGRRLVCSPAENPALFAATIGGLGLTGLILWAEFRLRRVPSAWVDVETVRFDRIDDLFALSAESDRDFEYTVAWIDCLSGGAALGRGLFMRGNAAADCGGRERYRLGGPPKFSVPADLPAFVLNPFAVRAFNFLYYRRQPERRRRAIRHYEPFFYPLDGIADWNRMYGRRGFFQYQCVLPGEKESLGPVRRLLEKTAAAGAGSFLAVAKLFGGLESPGILSFPRRGVTLALDFPNAGRRTLELMDSLDAVVMECGGAVYPAKDARMSPQAFRRYFPRWKELEAHRDPRFSSGFWRRVSEGA
ncbi:MAG TPA: FAD-binding oxidoreductase [Candidatus Eisenbacteria bacterium]|nr:FAD-binding oxidoreductase [Candidatus Eisenbacteria bacterium]